MLDLCRDRKYFIFASCFCLGTTIGVLPFAAAQQTVPQGAQVPALSVTTREVLLDVLVTDAHGQPVTGLTAADFHVTEQGTPQTIRQVDEHQPMSQADVARLAAAPAMPPNTFTNYVPIVNTNASTVILLDAINTPVAAQMYLREQLIKYLKNMQPGASIAIFQLDTEMRLIQGFSSDPNVLLAAAESKRNWPSLATPRYGNPYINQQSHLGTLRAGMQTMGRYLAGFPGRKNLIWFTGQVPITLFGEGIGSPFRDDFSVSEEDLLGLTDELRVSRVAVYPVDARGLQADPQFDASKRSSGRSAPAAGARFSERQFNDHSNLDLIADSTGGKAYYNTNGLDRVIAQVVNDGSNYYTLSYSTTNREWQGQFRGIKVAVDRPAVKLQYRPGYYAVNRDRQEQNQIAAMERRNARQGEFKPQAETPAGPSSGPDQGQGALVKPQPGGFAAAMELGAIPPTEIVFLAGLNPDDKTETAKKNASLPQENYLHTQWRNKPCRNYRIHIHGESNKVQFTRSPNGERHGEIEFVAVVYTPEGETVNSIEKTVSFDLKEDAYRLIVKFGFGVDVSIAIPVKGSYFLRVGVHDTIGNQMGALEFPVDQVKLGVAGAGFDKN